MRMAAAIATCFSLSLLLGNLCSMQLLAYATPTKAEASSSMTHADGIQFACKQKNSSNPITSVLPEGNACSSGHCLTKSDPTLWLQVLLPSPPLVSTIITPHPFILTFTSSPPLLAFHPSSSIGPPLDHIKTIVLRV